jgi:hypothetical protein
VTSKTATIFSGTLSSVGSVTTFSMASSDLVYVSASSAVLIGQFSRVCILCHGTLASAAVVQFLHY